MPAGSNAAYIRLFKNRDFVALWIGQMISFMGDYFNWLAIPIMINQLTGSTAMVGLSFIITSLPALFLGPIAGVFVDRWDRKRTMIISDIVRACLVLSLLLIKSPSQVWIFYVVGFLNSCVAQFFFPARGAVLPLILKDNDDLLPANALMQIIQMVGLLAGPALAGFAIGLWGERVAFIANSVGYLCSAIAIMVMHVPRTTPGSSPGANRIQAIVSDLREGVLYLFKHRSTVGVLICMGVAMLGIGGINVVWVPFLQATFGIGAAGLGMVDSAQGAGMIVGGLTMGFISVRLSKSTFGAGGMCLVAFPIALMGHTPYFALILVESFIVGLCVVPIQSAFTTIMQLAVPDLMRGRVMSSYGAVITAASLVSMGLTATFGEMIGLKNVYLVIGVIFFISGLLGFWLLKDPDEIQSSGSKELMRS